METYQTLLTYSYLLVTNSDHYTTPLAMFMKKSLMKPVQYLEIFNGNLQMLHRCLSLQLVSFQNHYIT